MFPDEHELVERVFGGDQLKYTIDLEFDGDLWSSRWMCYTFDSQLKHRWQGSSPTAMVDVWHDDSMLGLLPLHSARTFARKLVVARQINFTPGT